MYYIETLAGNYLCKFASLGNARRFARRNLPCQIRNKRGLLVPIN